MDKLEAELRKRAVYYIKGEYPAIIQETLPGGLEPGKVYALAIWEVK